MRHQLTRDSGIDSDHQTQSKMNEPITINRVRKQTIVPISDLKNESEYCEQVVMDDDESDKQSKNFLTSSTRDNSIEITNSSSIDDDNDAMVNLFRRNVVDEDEMCEDSRQDFSNRKKSQEFASNRRMLFKSKQVFFSKNGLVNL